MINRNDFEGPWIPSKADGSIVRLNRRTFLRRGAATVASITCADFLRFFLQNGMPYAPRDAAMAADAAKAAPEPRFLIYWYLEGGWESYDMFSPVVTPNHLEERLEDVGKERYRVLKFGQPGYGIYTQGPIRYGYLAEAGKHLFPDMAILSSMQTGSFHSGERLKVHMGSYEMRLQADREENERSVLQAFAEARGQSYLLPNLSWHFWLSDGELNEVQYTGRKGYYHALGPVHAHTIYGGTPADLKQFLLRMHHTSVDPVNQEIQKFLDHSHQYLLRDENLEVVKSYNSARQIYLSLVAKGLKLEASVISQLFTEGSLRERFAIQPGDELITYRSVNGNKARTKFSPATNVQAMMTYELMRAGFGCAFFIESRDIRRFDTHYTRRNLWAEDRRTPKGKPDQTAMMNEDLWKPLNALVDLLKNTPLPGSNQSLFDVSTIVLTSEFGRTIHGDVKAIKAMKIADEEKQTMIDGQDISQHWKVTSAAFLGGTVKGNTQYGSVGEKTLLAIPIMPDGKLDPAYHPITGDLKAGAKQNPKSFIPNHGDVYATALYLSDLDPRKKGRNDRGPLKFIKKTG